MEYLTKERTRAVGTAVLVAILLVGGFFAAQEWNTRRQFTAWEALAKEHQQGEGLMRQVRERWGQLHDNDKNNDIVANSYLAVAVSALGDKQRAIFYYERTLELDPMNRLALNNLANVYQDLTNWSEAERYFIRLLGADPAFAQGYRSLATLYQYRFNDPEDKIVKLTDAGLVATSNDPDLLTWVISYYQEKGEAEKALPYSEKLAEQLNNPLSPKSSGIELKAK